MGSYDVYECMLDQAENGWCIAIEGRGRSGLL